MGSGGLFGIPASCWIRNFVLYYGKDDDGGTRSSVADYRSTSLCIGIIVSDLVYSRWIDWYTWIRIIWSSDDAIRTFIADGCSSSSLDGINNHGAEPICGNNGTRKDEECRGICDFGYRTFVGCSVCSTLVIN